MITRLRPEMQQFTRPIFIQDELAASLRIDTHKIAQEKFQTYVDLSVNFDYEQFSKFSDEEKREFFVCAIALAQKLIEDIGQLDEKYTSLVTILTFRLGKVRTDYLEGVYSLSYASQTLSSLIGEMDIILFTPTGNKEKSTGFFVSF